MPFTSRSRECAHPRPFGVSVRLDGLERSSQANDPADVVGPASAVTFLPAPVDDRADRRGLAYDEHPHAPWTAQLVGAHGHEVGAGGRGTQIEVRRRLHRVGMHERARRTSGHRLDDGVERLEHAHLVVGEHHRDQRHIGVEQAVERVQVDHALGVDPKHPKLNWLDASEPGGGPCDRLTRREHRCMLDRRAHDRAGRQSCLQSCGKRSDDGQAVGLTAT